jgi:uncharacterized protein (UPF0332 family)
VKPEIEALLRKASESLRASQLLSREGYSDFAAARAYYAMFYAAQALLLGRNLSYSKHSAVIAAFGKEFAKTGPLNPKYHRYLIDAQDYRNLCDYGIGPALTAERAEDVIRWAGEFVVAAAEELHRT